MNYREEEILKISKIAACEKKFKIHEKNNPSKDFDVLFFF